MSNQKAQSYRVVYDIEKNIYYRVDNITGQRQPSYKTGKLPAKFDPQVTGADYNVRKKLNPFSTMDYVPTETKNSHKSNHRKYQTETSEEKYNGQTQLLSRTLQLNSKINRQTQIRLMEQKMTLKNGNLSNIKHTSQTLCKDTYQQNAQQDTSLMLPRLKKNNSSSILDIQKISKTMSNPSIFNTLKNSKLVQNSLPFSAQKENKNQESFVNSMTRLNLSSMADISQSRMDWDQFENRLKKYCQIQQIKLHQNNYEPLSNNQNSQRFQKFAQKSLLTSVLDESHLTMQQTNRLNYSSMNEKSQRNTVTKSQVLHSIDQQEKQKATLLLLAKKCQKPNSFVEKNSKKQASKQSEIGFKIANLKSGEQQNKLKCLLQKQKETFLSFYPKYIFRQNPRLIQEQKDRKINLKKLEQSYLQNNEKKYGRIYHSRSIDGVQKKE